MTLGWGRLPDSPAAAAVMEVLADAQRQGFIGPGSLTPHVVHALGFSRALAETRGAAFDSNDRVIDLGAGGGLPGLVLAVACPESQMSLVEGSTRRGLFLEGAVRRCGLGERVAVVTERAEIAGRYPNLRGQQTVVVSRSFGSPGETAECASPFLAVGGLLIVSEPPLPRLPGSWSQTGLDLLGLSFLRSDAAVGGFSVLRQVEPCPDRFPRRVGVPRKKPLF
jgi:16S rRNA (guanine527-N7)-methyltransferase